MLSGVMLFDFLGWNEAARLIESSMEKTIAAEVCDLRLRAADAGRDQGEDERVCYADDREHVSCESHRQRSDLRIRTGKAADLGQCRVDR